jgi:hypothetical protein
MKKLLMSLAAFYLVKAKEGEKPACFVARFHLGNGATLGRINWLADESKNGMRQSLGIMVNYISDKSTLAQNHEAFEQKNSIICTADVRQHLPKYHYLRSKKNPKIIFGFSTPLLKLKSGNDRTAPIHAICLLPNHQLIGIICLLADVFE